MKTIKNIFTYMIAILCVVTSLNFKSDDLTVSNEESIQSKITIYVSKNNELVPISLYYEHENNIADNIKNAFNLMKKGIDKEGFVSIIPNSILLVDVKVKDQVIYLNFNEAIYTMNSDSEWQFIEGVVNTVLQFDGSMNVMFLVNGDRIDKMPLSNRKMGLFSKDIGINNFKLESNGILNTKSKYVISYVEDNMFSYYVINTIRFNKDVDILDFVNYNFERISAGLSCENVEFNEDVMVLHLSELFLFDESTVKTNYIESVIYTLKMNGYSDRFMLKVNNEPIKLEGFKSNIIELEELYLNVFEQ